MVTAQPVFRDVAKTVCVGAEAPTHTLLSQNIYNYDLIKDKITL
jgi:hypothetical protein